MKRLLLASTMLLFLGLGARFMVQAQAQRVGQRGRCDKEWGSLKSVYLAGDREPVLMFEDSEGTIRAAKVPRYDEHCTCLYELRRW